MWLHRVGAKNGVPNESFLGKIIFENPRVGGTRKIALVCGTIGEFRRFS